MALFLLAKPAVADEEEEHERWLLATYVPGNLALSADPSLVQWKHARMLGLQALDGAPMAVMAVHNGTYALFLISRPLNGPIEQAGAIIAFLSVAPNGSDVLWAWTGGKALSPLDPSVKIEQRVANDELVLVFGRALNNSQTGFPMSVGETYVLKVTSWANGTSIASVDLDLLQEVHLELLPYLDVYPKAPLVYSAVLALAAIGFVAAEVKRHEAAQLD